jgi:hypothetical protein
MRQDERDSELHKKSLEIERLTGALLQARNRGKKRLKRDHSGNKTSGRDGEGNDNSMEVDEFHHDLDDDMEIDDVELQSLELEKGKREKSILEESEKLLHQKDLIVKALKDELTSKDQEIVLLRQQLAAKDRELQQAKSLATGGGASIGGGSGIGAASIIGSSSSIASSAATAFGGASTAFGGAARRNNNTGIPIPGNAQQRGESPHGNHQNHHGGFGSRRPSVTNNDKTASGLPTSNSASAIFNLKKGAKRKKSIAEGGPNGNNATGNNGNNNGNNIGNNATGNNSARNRGAPMQDNFMGPGQGSNNSSPSCETYVSCDGDSKELAAFKDNVKDPNVGGANGNNNGNTNNGMNTGMNRTNSENNTQGLVGKKASASTAASNRLSHLASSRRSFSSAGHGKPERPQQKWELVAIGENGNAPNGSGGKTGNTGKNGNQNGNAGSNAKSTPRSDNSTPPSSLRSDDVSGPVIPSTRGGEGEGKNIPRKLKDERNSGNEGGNEGAAVMMM